MNRSLLLCLLVALILRLIFVLLVFPVLQDRWPPVRSSGAAGLGLASRLDLGFSR